MVLVQPPGKRSCFTPQGEPGEGGTWTHCMPKDTNQSFLKDLDDELNDSNMGESDKKVFRRELYYKMKRAESGELRFGSNARRHDVDVIASSRNHLLELRHNDITTVDQTGEMVPRLSRLYFSERRSHPGELLGILFSSKAPGPIGLEEQNGHIKSARGRLLSHETQGR